MAAAQLVQKGIVLKKTKLGESDLIVTLAGEDGARFQVVAKGARKPQNVLSSRMELLSDVQLFCAQGKGLPIVQEARLLASHAQVRSDFEKAAAASVFAELVTKGIQDDLPMQRLYALCQTLLSQMDEASPVQSLSLALAACLKFYALSGVCPSFDECVCCGADAPKDNQGKAWAFSYLDGGYVCDACKLSCQVISFEAAYLLWLDALLHTSFAQIAQLEVPPRVISFGYRFCQEWCRSHFGSSLKAVSFLLTSITLPQGD